MAGGSVYCLTYRLGLGDEMRGQVMNTYQLGCIIDGSHWSAADINHATIVYAETRGWTVGWMDAYTQTPEDWEAWLSDVADEAIAWLNDHHAPAGTAYFFEDNSLFLEPTDWDG